MVPQTPVLWLLRKANWYELCLPLSGRGFAGPGGNALRPWKLQNIKAMNRSPEAFHLCVKNIFCSGPYWAKPNGGSLGIQEARGFGSLVDRPENILTVAWHYQVSHVPYVYTVTSSRNSFPLHTKKIGAVALMKFYSKSRCVKHWKSEGSRTQGQ